MATEQEDYEAALELASQMQLIDGAKFLRAETGISLTEALHLCKRVARIYPDSPMAAAVEEYQEKYQFP